MNQKQLLAQLVLANIVEINKRVLCGLVGNDLSTKVDGSDVMENSEALIVSKLRQALVTKGVN